MENKSHVWNHQPDPVNCIITPRQICSSWLRISKCGDRHGLSHTWQTDQWIKVTTTGTRCYEVPLSPEFHHFWYKMWDIIDILWQFLTISEIFWFDSEGLVKLWCASFPSPHSCTGLQIISRKTRASGRKLSATSIIRLKAANVKFHFSKNKASEWSSMGFSVFKH